MNVYHDEGIKMTIEPFIDEIRAAIEETLAETPDAPETDVVREVVANMIIGEPPAVQSEVRRRFGQQLGNI
jgi:hypothetical protein